MAGSNDVITQTVCYHCGEPCKEEQLVLEDKTFCCQGCKMVFEILNENGLCNYYELEHNPGISLKNKDYEDKFSYLDNEAIRRKLLDFESEALAKITFHVPSIHCSSCIWLLENLHKLQDGIQHCRVDFMKKKLSLDYNPKVISLREAVELLATIGYEPAISLDTMTKNAKPKTDRSLYLKIGVAGFCFGNIMMLSFPEYFGFEGFDEKVKYFIAYINMMLALPVVFYASAEYFKSAWQGIRQKYLTIDLPIILGILALFLRSSYEVIMQIGQGYFDSLAGLLFFLLVGKWFQQKTYDSISFERDYKSYFPLAVTRFKGEEQENVPVNELEVGDEILIRHQELIPADAILLSKRADIDYSFVTGEAEPDKRKAGDYLYAGGRQMGASIHLRIEKPVSQSYLTQLWNRDAFRKEKEFEHQSLINQISKYFTAIVLVIAFGAGGFWLSTDPAKAAQVFTSVLIVACPCALALSSPFTLGNTMRWLGKARFYVKNAHVIEKMGTVDTIVVDKTGTITQAGQQQVQYEGSQLTKEEEKAVVTLAGQSTHPLSRKLVAFLREKGIKEGALDQFEETEGRGISGKVDEWDVRLGSLKHMDTDSGTTPFHEQSSAAVVYVALNGELKGRFLFKNEYREELPELIEALKVNFDLALLSGDHETEKQNLSAIFPEGADLKFRQSPEDKLEYIRNLQQKGKKVMMLGDGLNDAGALKQSDVGVAVTEDIASFSPACDGILEAGSFGQLVKFIRFAKNARKVIIGSFVISFLYNVVGLSFAVAGHLTPVFAAILMPLSSISVVLFATGAISLVNHRLKITLVEK